MRDNTERPVTVTVGSNVMTGNDPVRILDAVDAVLGGGGSRVASRSCGTATQPSGLSAFSKGI